MSRIRRTLVLTAVLGLVSSVLLASSALAQESSSGASTDEVILDIGVDSDITSLNPFNICCGPDYEVMGLIYDTAWNYDRSTLEAVPGFVREWQHTDDYMDWTLTTAEGATWSDGEPATANDVAFTFGMIADNQMPFFKDYFPFHPTFEVVNDTTVIWHSAQPTYAPTVPAYSPILPEHIWSQYVVPGDPKATRAAAKEFENTDPIGTGPFTLEDREKGSLITLKVKDDYWMRDVASITEIRFHVYDNQEAMVQALKNGELDVVDGLKATLYNSLEGEPNIQTHTGDAGCWGNLAWNFGGQGPKANPNPVIHQLAFRQAMAYAINKQEIVDKVYQGTATVGTSVLLPGMNGSWVTDIPQEDLYSFDPEKSKQLLDSIGVKDTNGDGFREYQGKEIDLYLMSLNDVSGSVDTGKLLESWFADVGIKSHLDPVVDTDKAYVVWGTGEFDAYVWDWCSEPDPGVIMSYFLTSQCLGWSDGCWSNPHFDELYELQKTQFDRADRKETLDEMQVLLAHELPTMVLANWTDLQAIRTDTFDPSTWRLTPDNDTGLYIMGWTAESYFTLMPVGAGTAGETTTGLPAWIWLAVGGGLALIVVVIVLARRKGEADEA
jgi:peptide/nickel transport system substrate-binding protein